MLYVATVHFKTSKWIRIQQRYLQANLSQEFKVFAVLNQIGPEYHDAFDRVVDAYGPHEGKLNLLGAEICAEARPDDIILFLDGDAFPIADPMPVVNRGLRESALVAVRRDENRGDPQPHPCFCAVRVEEWLRLPGDWSRGHTWLDTNGSPVTDVGANLLRALERTNTPWTPLLRTNRRNDHPLFFGIYADAVYHHGAGFRTAESRADQATQPWRLRGERLPWAGRPISSFNRSRHDKWQDSVRSDGAALAQTWFERIESDPHFYRLLLSEPAADRTRA